MNKIFKLSLFLLIALMPCGALAADEAPAGETKKSASTVPNGTCEVNIFFSWHRTPIPISYHDELTGKTFRMKLEKEATEPQEVFFQRIQGKGTKKDVVQNKLELRIPEIKRKALDYCQHEYQDESSCITRRMKQIKEQYQGLDFHARKQMLTSIKNDCLRNLGVCTGTRAADAVCYEFPEHKEEEGKKKGKKG